MKIKVLSMMAAAALTTSAFLPAMADGGGPVGMVGAATATVIDTPEGMVLDSLWRCPVKASKGLAETFGDENGWKQQIVGAVIGVPCGVVFGIPYGAFHGMHHAWTTGWDKPFRTESFIVTDSDK
jgi:hypothetical protein